MSTEESLVSNIYSGNTPHEHIGAAFTPATAPRTIVKGVETVLFIAEGICTFIDCLAQLIAWFVTVVAAKNGILTELYHCIAMSADMKVFNFMAHFSGFDLL
jgi:hypothetical protein